MSQALAELRPPVSEEALRLRMVALHGREDPLLDTVRFGRLLRQANDAEVADVRQVGENDHEISPHPRAPALPPRPAPVLAAPAALPSSSVEDPAGVASEPPTEPASGARENGQRLGVRFRRGSRGPLRTSEIPLIGVVRVESPPPAEAPLAAEEVLAEPTAAKPSRPRRAPRKRTAAAAAAAPAPKQAASPEVSDAPPAARPKRPRTRARKKAE
jgi:hypothetical protein